MGVTKCYVVWSHPSAISHPAPRGHFVFQAAIVARNYGIHGVLDTAHATAPAAGSNNLL